jgi:biopolymer transport protein ExbB
MTALGLAVAIPAVLGYNAISRINKVLIAELNRFGNDLYAYFITGATVGGTGNNKISAQD